MAPKGLTGCPKDFTNASSLLYLFPASGIRGRLGILRTQLIAHVICPTSRAYSRMNVSKRRTTGRLALAWNAGLRVVKMALSGWPKMPAPLTIVRVSTQQEFQDHVTRTKKERENRAKLEQTICENAPSFTTPGFCFVCRKWTQFRSSWAWSYEFQGRREINWREHLVCPSCGLNNRMRAAIHLLAGAGVSLKRSQIYVTEQTTPLFARLRERCPSIVGSENLGQGVPLGTTNSDGIANQDLTKLTFPDGCFDLILSLEVMEHVPNYLQAFAECARVLKPGGKIFFSAPFDVTAACNRIRARLKPDGTIEHLLPPEYHGDPLNSAGCLCFQYFGWEMLDQVKRAGFARAWALLYYSRDYGYLGNEQIQFLAEK